MYLLQIDLWLIVEKFILIGAIVSSSNHHTKIAFIPNELVQLSTLIVVSPRVAASPGIRMDARVFSVGIVEEGAQVDGNT